MIFAALQAVVDGNDFDVAWRTTVCPALTMLGVRGASDAPALNPVGEKTDGLCSVRDDLETLSGKLDSLEDLARFLAMEVQGGGHSEATGSFFSIMNLVEYCKDEANQLVDRLSEDTSTCEVDREQSPLASKTHVPTYDALLQEAWQIAPSLASNIR